MTALDPAYANEPSKEGCNPMSITHTGFHAHDGWYFERQDDGSVKISAAVGRSTETIVLTAAEWPSVVAAVCSQGGTAETYQEAVRLHDHS